MLSAGRLTSKFSHLHAPQFKMMGMFLDRPLLDWLQKYTFPNEARFADAAYAEKVYPHVIRSTLENGTTTAAYFDTIFTDSTLILANQAQLQVGFESLFKSGFKSSIFFVFFSIPKRVNEHSSEKSTWI